jgi:uncharacterized membrane protein
MSAPAGTAPAPDALRIDAAGAAFLLAAATVLAVAGLVLPTGVRWVLTPAVLLLPGHALVCATFGHRLEFGGVRRLSLAAVLTLATYPILALAVFSLGLRMTNVTVAASTWALVAGCAGVVVVRSRRVLAGTVTDDAPPGSRAAIDPRQLVVPVTAMVLALLIAWAGVQFLPRREPAPFSVAAFAGPWALVDEAVGYEGGQGPSVDLSVTNRTQETLRYTVEPRVIADDGSVTDWPGTVVELDAGGSRDLSVTGPVPGGQCRARTEVRVTPSGGPPLDPLTAYLRDRNAVCTGTGGGD